ncbi:hypothetical protein ASE31_06060 [Acidovorax sp. Root217]|nr:hypothetical protein ASE31_06060 [Acidovorax sp. Root217]
MPEPVKTSRTNVCWDARSCMKLKGLSYLVCSYLVLQVMLISHQARLWHKRDCSERFLIVGWFSEP